jgi:hypothetical protein
VQATSPCPKYLLKYLVQGLPRSKQTSPAYVFLSTDQTCRHPANSHWEKLKSRVTSAKKLKNDIENPPILASHQEAPVTSADEEKVPTEESPKVKRSRTQIFRQKAPKYAFIALKLGLVIGTLVAQLA